MADLPRVPVICAFTATADPKLQKALCAELKLRRPAIVKQPLHRPNLHYHALLSGEPDQWVTAYCRKRAGEKGIIFCRTRAETERMAGMLCAAGVTAGCYHAGLTGDQRERNQAWFASGDLPVLTATSAFGMGVDIPDIRYVIHTGICESPMDYVQQAGRAGRDGKDSDCIQVITPAELDWHRRYLRASKDKEAASSLQQMLELFLSGSCISQGLVHSFGQKSGPCGCCSACLRMKRGRRVPLAATPYLAGMTPRDLREWCLRTCRDDLSCERGIAPSRILSEAGLVAAAEHGDLPEDMLDTDAYMRMCGAIRF